MLLRSLAIVALFWLEVAQALAQSPEPSLLPEDPSQRFVRTGSIAIGLSAASTAVAAGLLPTQPKESLGRGVGIGHAMFAGVYAFSGVMNLIGARRMSRRGGPAMTRNATWVYWVNFGASAGLTSMGALVAALPISDDDRGVGITFAAHGSWFLTYAIVQLVKARRGRITWMAAEHGAIRF